MTYIRKRAAISKAALLTLICTISLLIGFSGPASQVRAADAAQLELQSTVGFGEAGVKQGRWFPATFTIANSGGNVAGDLEVQIAGFNGDQDYSYVQHVELPKNSTKVVTMLLPGGTYLESNNVIRFYEDSAAKGKPIKFAGNDYLASSVIPAEVLEIGVLAKDPDTLNFLGVLTQSGKRVSLIHMAAADVPKEALALDSLDVLVINDFASDHLEEEQVKAINGWVQRGGSLMLAGGAGYPKTASPFQAASPVSYQGTASVQELPALAAIGEKELIFNQPFTVSKAQLTEGAEAIATQGDNPLFAKKSFGQGEVWYAAYDVSLNPLASWNGNTRLWERLLNDRFLELGISPQGNVKLGPEPFWQLNQALDYFPSLMPPRIGILAWTMLLYTFVVGPFVYFILRRMDKREWAWVVIPVLAIVTSLGIYQFGAANRGSLLTQSFHMVELDGTGSGTRQSALSVFMPKGGGAELQFPDNVAARPFMSTEIAPGAELRNHSNLFIRNEKPGTNISIQDIPYSSVSKMYLVDGQPMPAGKLEYTVDLSQSEIKGELTNKTQQDMTDAGLILNNRYVAIGELKAGESKSFDSSSGVTYPNIIEIANIAFPYPAGPVRDDPYFHKRNVLMAYLQQRKVLSEPLIIGWSNEKAARFRIDGSNASTDQLTLWAQDLKLNYVDGDRVYIPQSALTPAIVENRLQILGLDFQNGPYIQMGGGDIVFEYRLPNILGALYQQMTLQSEANHDVSAYIWNGQKSDWDPLDLGQMITWDDKQLEPYLLQGSAIRIKADTAQQSVMFRFPAVSLEGKVSK